MQIICINETVYICMFFKRIVSSIKKSLGCGGMDVALYPVTTDFGQ